MALGVEDGLIHGFRGMNPLPIEVFEHRLLQMRQDRSGLSRFASFALTTHRANGDRD